MPKVLPVDPELWTLATMYNLPLTSRLLTSGREETDSKLMRFSALVGERLLLGLLQLLEPSVSLSLFPCSKQKSAYN